ncbi:exo-alpha-sialidase [Nesterenkonia haasae]|uniref:exo-alpha-sialidase n=1 Tax=Nesterenkonia haasae TaxID=2587813 RepID=UPI0013914217|nr:exo-alpha-sialidase [Nesterenkonia haasae]
MASHSEAAPDYDASPFWAGEPIYTEQDLAVAGEGGFPNYRIPALTVTNEGTVLASYDGRPTSGDAPGPNSILQRRSDDGGRTWQEQTFIREGDTEAPIEGYSDPSYVVDRETGNIFNFHVFSMDQGFIGSKPGVDPADRNVIHANVSVSSDDGETWEHQTVTEDITADLDWRSRFAAAGQGIQLKYGPHAGRLIQQYTIINGAGDFQAVSVFSDDHGETWQAGEPVGVGMDENKTVELSDGRVMLNSRDSHNSGFRKVAISEDGGATYGEVTLDRQLPDPTNNASILRAFPNAEEGSDRAQVLLFSNAASQAGRSNGTVRASCDDGETWPIAQVFQPGTMSYSTMATLPNGNVGLLYEPSWDSIRYAEFNLAWLEGLCAPLSAEDLTVERGEAGSSTVSVEHQLGPAIQGIDVETEAPEGWDVSADGAPERLTPGRSADFTVNVDVPESVTGGTYDVPLVLTDAKGRSSQGTLVVDVPRTEYEVDGMITVTGGTLVDPQDEPYEVGDRLTFTYDIVNVSDATTTVTPSGNLRDLDPDVDSRNCRWRNLPGGGNYTCDFPYHTVTQEDLDRGKFVPTTTWTSTSGDEVTEVEHEGPAVELP